MPEQDTTKKDSATDRSKIFETQIFKEFKKAEAKKKETVPIQPQAQETGRIGQLMVDEIFVIYKGGILLSHQTRRLMPYSDNEIVAGMLTAVLNYVQDFVRDTFQQKATPIRRIEYGEYKIIIETGEHIVIAAVLGGAEPANTTNLMKDMITKIEDKYRNFFENWDGDINKIKEVDGFVGDLVRSIMGSGATPTMIQPATVPEKVPVQQSHPSPTLATPPTREITEDKIDLKKSFCYLVKEERPHKAYIYFNQAIKSGVKGLCVSRDPPMKIRGKFDLPESIPVIWLSNTPSDQSMQPKNLEKIAFALFEFMGKDEGVLVLIDCIEYLITNNNFNTVLKFVQSLKDKVSTNKSILMVTTNPAALESQQINLMEREMDVVV